MGGYKATTPETKLSKFVCSSRGSFVKPDECQQVWKWAELTSMLVLVTSSKWGDVVQQALLHKMTYLSPLTIRLVHTRRGGTSLIFDYSMLGKFSRVESGVQDKPPRGGYYQEPFIETLTLNVLNSRVEVFLQWCEVKPQDNYSHYILEKNRSTQIFNFRKITIPQCKNKSKSPAF